MSVAIPLIVSVDDHVIEPPDLWERWLPRKYRGRGPRVVPGPWEMVEGSQSTRATRSGWSAFRVGLDGPETDWWVYEDQRVGTLIGNAAAGLTPAEIAPGPIRFADMRPGCYDGKARLADMDVNHVERSLCFPTFPRFCGQSFLWGEDKDLALAGVRAYNDFMVDEWAGESGGRLIPLCLIPLWDAKLAAAEVRRNAARGVRAVAFSELPAALGLPSIHDLNRYWDPFFAACDETGTVLCIHIGSSSTVPITSPDAPPGVQISLTTVNSQLSMADWLLSGLLIRFPNLKIAYSESQIGWMPYLWERLDTLWRKGNALIEMDPLITQPPSSYVPGRIFGCFFEDDFGMRARARSGSTRSPSKPTTRIRTRRGPTRSSTRKWRWPTSRRTKSTRSCGAMPSSCSALTKSSRMEGHPEKLGDTRTQPSPFHVARSDETRARPTGVPWNQMTSCSSVWTITSWSRPTCSKGGWRRADEEAAPHMVRKPDGTDVWVYEGKEYPNIGLNAVAGCPPEEYGLEPTSLENIRKGTWDVTERVKDMSANGVLASINFPSFPRFAGQLFSETAARDPYLALAVIRAYNDWHLEGWCGAAPDRLIPMAIPIFWDADLLRQEMVRVSELGCHAVTFSANPYDLGYPSLHSDFWDPFWAVCAEREIVVCMHLGSNSVFDITAPDAPMTVEITRAGIRLFTAADDLIWSPVVPEVPHAQGSALGGGHRLDPVLSRAVGLRLQAP